MTTLAGVCFYRRVLYVRCVTQATDGIAMREDNGFNDTRTERTTR
jgi:hypothetical protein